ncbi:MAG: N-6 DNA methylase [Prevotella sp.]|nr:N-6 DNA methylase [Prevotella sp.]
MLLQKNIVKKYLGMLDEQQTHEAWNQYQSYFLNEEIQQNIKQSKEEQFQEGFLRELFVKVLGYTLNPSPNYNLITEKKNETNAKKADGAIEKDGKVIGIIELKDHKTTDLSKVESQAFNYKSQHPDARYVIISNFEKLRLYLDNAVECREWDLFRITENDFRELYLCLSWTQVERGIAIQMKNESVSSEDQITKALYKDYSQFKRVLFADILEQNPTPEEKDTKDWQLLLFKKTQKLLDRLLFIFFAEDCGLLPPNSMVKIIEQWTDLREKYDEYFPLYDRIKKYFGYMNTGHQGKQYEIFAYNGGLFKPDEVLDNIKISDDVLAEHTRKLSEYDFESDVDVNILGHIFENSLNEIEEVTQQITSGAAPQTSKRKQDGVFYTPQYITKYIVENTIGRLCTEKKAELNIIENEYFSDQRRQIQTKKRLLERLHQYREWLLTLTILDPACGSGAFLNAALQFLMSEHKHIDEMEAKVTGSSIVFQDIENSILENNLYGVDINEESVEIAQLALWLRTAKPHRKLNTLNQNIKCGNSLISDPAIAGSKAFDWQKEFPQVFEKGGFDVVIGNPPYGILIDDSLKDYYNQHFPLAQYKLNLYILFLERMFQIFNNGIVSFIIPKSLLINTYFADIRKFILTHSKVTEMFTITEKVFEDAEVGSSLIITYEIHNDVETNNLVRLANCEKTKDFMEQCNIIENYIAQSELINSDKAEIVIQSQDSTTIKNRIEKIPCARESYKFKNGLNPGNIKDKLITRNQNEVTKRIIWGKEISRYGIQWGGDYILYDEHIADNLTLDDVQSKKGMNKQKKIDFALRDKSLFETEKIVIRKTGDRLICCYDNNNFYFDTLVHGIYQLYDNYSLKYILAILNSKPATYFYRCLHDIKGKVFAKISLDDLSNFPIPKITETNKVIVEEMISLADTMLTLHQQLQDKRSRFLRRLTENFEGVKITTALQQFDQLDFKSFVAELKKQKIKLTLSQQDEWEDYFTERVAECQEITAQIKATDNEIDNRVFDLYGLTEEERRIVIEG